MLFELKFKTNSLHSPIWVVCPRSKASVYVAIFTR